MNAQHTPGPRYWPTPKTDCPTCKGNPYWGKTLSSWTRCPNCVAPRAAIAKATGSAS